MKIKGNELLWEEVLKYSHPTFKGEIPKDIHEQIISVFWENDYISKRKKLKKYHLELKKRYNVNNLTEIQGNMVRIIVNERLLNQLLKEYEMSGRMISIIVGKSNSYINVALFKRQIHEGYIPIINEFFGHEVIRKNRVNTFVDSENISEQNVNKKTETVR